MIEKIERFLSDYWMLLIMILVGGIAGMCFVQCVIASTFAWMAAFLGWVVAGVACWLTFKQKLWTEYKVLEGKKEVVDSYTDLLEQTKKSIEYFSGYDEAIMDSVAVYSQMATSGVEAPIANSIISFVQDLGPEHTVLLVGIDHSNTQWSVRIAGRPIYLSQLRAIWALVHRHLEEYAAPAGALIIKKNSSIMN